MGNKLYVYIFEGIAGLIIIVASINYMNLSTARSGKRSKESACASHWAVSEAACSTVHAGIFVLVSIGFVVALLLLSYRCLP